MYLQIRINWIISKILKSLNSKNSENVNEEERVKLF